MWKDILVYGESSFVGVMFVFFFSSRRRHTRLQGDWSSDVCSSDLGRQGAAGARRLLPRPAFGGELPRRAGHRLDAARGGGAVSQGGRAGARDPDRMSPRPKAERDRKSTRLNSSHLVISYAVFCLKKKN